MLSPLYYNEFCDVYFNTENSNYNNSNEINSKFTFARLNN